MTGPPTPPPLVGVVWTETGEGKAAERSTRDRGFLPQQRDCHKQPVEGPCGAPFSEPCRRLVSQEKEHICMEILKRNRKQELELTELEVE